MPYTTEIRCPTNGLHYASFYNWSAYYYRLENGIEFPLDVDYAWCFNCERFVECERIYSIHEIQQRIDDLVDTKDNWGEQDKFLVERFAKLGRDLPSSLKQATAHKTWVAALAWRQNRKTPPRCLECGSFFSIKILPQSEEVPHPSGNCTIIVTGGDHASVTGLPDLAYFNADGVRIHLRQHLEVRDQ